MSIYGSFTESSKEVPVTLTETELNILGEELLEGIIVESDYFDESFDEFISENFDETLEEGANIDMTKAIKTNGRRVVYNLVQAKKNLKAENYSEAKKNVNEAKSELKKMEDKVRDTKSNFGSVLCGTVAGSLVAALRITLPCKLITAGLKIPGKALIKAGSKGAPAVIMKALNATNTVAKGLNKANKIYTAIKTLIHIIEKIKQFIENIKDPKAKAGEVFNSYRNELLVLCKDTNKQLDDLYKDIEKKEKSGSEEDK